MWSKCGTYDPLRTSVCVISISIPIATRWLTVLAGLSFAGDTVVQADNGLRITSTASVLSQAEASTAAGVQGPQSATVANTTTTAPAAAVPDPREAAWFSGFHLSGYVGQTFGMWQNPSALRDFTPSRNNLAVSRTAVQFDENFRLMRLTASSCASGSSTNHPTLGIVQTYQSIMLSRRSPQPSELRSLHERLVQSIHGARRLVGE